MSELEPAAALTVCERALRQLISSVLQREVGDGWLQAVASPQAIESWRERRTDEQANRAKRGVAEVETNELAYAQFYQLLEILEKNWDKFAPALGKKKDTGALLRRFDDLRNTVAHSRSLLSFERDLLSGIAGEVRNRVALYMSSADPTGNYYPRIDSILDTFGNNVERFQLDQIISAYVTTRTKLRPGDTVTFSCTATDPQDREIRWRLIVSLRQIATAEGKSVNLSWTVGHQDVAHAVVVEIHMWTPSAQYHRWPMADQMVSISYEVTPPVV